MNPPTAFAMLLARPFILAAMCVVPLAPVAHSQSSPTTPSTERSSTGETQIPSLRLSPEGEARQDAHRFLLDVFCLGKPCRFLGEGSGRMLDEVVISKRRQSLSGEVLIALPPGTERVASMFRYLVFRGQGLDQLEGLEMLPYAADSNMAISTKTPELYRVKVSAMPTPNADMPAIKIRTRCKPGQTAVITEVALNSQGKLPVTFDDIPYRNLGEEFPRKTVRIDIESDHELSLAGHVDLERDKFCRYYAAPGHVHPSFERWAHERNFSPGRQILKLQPALVVGYSAKGPKLTESKSRPGAADLTFFDTYQSGEQIVRAIKPFRDIEYAMCFNDYPEFMSIHGVGRGTPLVEHFDDAAQLAAAYVADEVRDAGRSATFWEVKNESTIKSEWDYHYNKDVDSWQLLARLHNQVADAVHSKAPGTRVGGPTSAWMQLQAADFGLYRNQTRFMDQTADHVDFYSHHFYEDIGSLGAWERRQGKYTNYLLGRLEATLDMLRSHMHQTDNIKPILVTEFGSLQPGRGPSDYWLRLRTYNAYLNKFMQRPDEIDLAVPFAFLSIPWNPKSGDTAFIPKDGKHNHSPISDCDPTPIVYLFELWRDFDGRRLPVAHDQRWLDVTAVHADKTIKIAMTNMGGRQINVDLSEWASKLSVNAVSQRRLYYRDGRVIFEDAVTHGDTSCIPVDVEETTIVTLSIDSPLQPNGLLQRRRWYAPGTATKTSAFHGNPIPVQVDLTTKLKRAKLIIGVHREEGLGGPIDVTFNESPLEMNTAWADDFNHLFAPLEVDIPVDLVRKDNEIRIRDREGLTITSVHLLTDSYDPSQE